MQYKHHLIHTRDGRTIMYYEDKGVTTPLELGLHLSDDRSYLEVRVLDAPMGSNGRNVILACARHQIVKDGYDLFKYDETCLPKEDHSVKTGNDGEYMNMLVDLGFIAGESLTMKHAVLAFPFSKDASELKNKLLFQRLVAASGQLLNDWYVENHGRMPTGETVY